MEAYLAPTVARKTRAPAPLLRERVQVSTAQLRAGMFILELDRPWEDTPFLLQGFLIDEAEQISTLRRLCSTVAIDPRRSDLDSLRDLSDIYIQPEIEPEAPPIEEPRIKIRLVEGPRDAALLDNASVVSQVQSKVKAVMRRLREGPTAEEIRAERLREAKERMKASALAAAQENRPTKVHVQYLPAERSDETKVRANWLASRRRANVQFKPVARTEAWRSQTATRFDDFVAALYPDWSGWAEGIESWGKRLRRWFARSRSHPIRWTRGPASRRPARQRVRAIPATIELLIYRDTASIQAEVPRAREAIQSAEETLELLRQDMIVEGKLSFDGLPVVVDALVGSIKRNSDALIWVSRVRVRDSETYARGIKAASYLLAFGRHLGFQAHQLGQLATIGLLMDVGKLNVDPSVLNKQGPLTPEEIEQVRAHVESGVELLGQTTLLDSAVREGIMQHHERVDGTGYPEGLAGDEISVFGRMAAIVDAYTAMTTARGHAAPVSSYDALQVLYGQADQQFHGALVEEFVRAIGLFPVGSLVLLSSEEVAVVTSLDRKHRLEPVVLVLTTPDKHALPRPYELDLSRHAKDSRGNRIRILRSLPVGVHGIEFRNFYVG